MFYNTNSNVNDNSRRVFGYHYSDRLIVKHLRWSNQGMRSLPYDALNQFPNVEVIDLHDNRLTSLPDDINQLTKLRILTLYSNKLTDVSSLAGLENLESINLAHNKLETIPSWLYHPPPKLKTICLGFNYINDNELKKFKLYCQGYGITVHSSEQLKNIKNGGSFQHCEPWIKPPLFTPAITPSIEDYPLIVAQLRATIMSLHQQIASLQEKLDSDNKYQAIMQEFQDIKLALESRVDESGKNQEDSEWDLVDSDDDCCKEL